MPNNISNAPPIPMRIINIEHKISYIFLQSGELNIFIGFNLDGVY
jgi:hypothetical protein